MRPLSILLLLCLSVGCSTTKKANSKTSFLNGTWVPVKQEFAGKLLAPAAFEKQILILNDSMYTLTAESVDKGVVRYKDDKMDIYGKEGVNAGKHFTAIYKFENGELTICYNLAGNSYPETFDTNGKPLYFLSVFKKN
jgi:uncharacterized protein (TIGR03067 family)